MSTPQHLRASKSFTRVHHNNEETRKIRELQTLLHAWVFTQTTGKMPPFLASLPTGLPLFPLVSVFRCPVYNKPNVKFMYSSNTENTRKKKKRVNSHLHNTTAHQPNTFLTGIHRLWSYTSNGITSTCKTNQRQGHTSERTEYVTYLHFPVMG